MSCLLPERVVQLHPSTRCNLACAHCYSSSAPGDAPSLDAGMVVDALAVLADEGYRVLSISGGEPFLYQPLAEVADAARRLGFHVSIVTNGAAVTRAKAEAVAPSVSTVAVSFDGRPERHDTIRGKQGSFALAERGLGLVAEQGLHVGVICCVTRHSLADVPWLYERAREWGAALFQLRPLALTGRAEATLSDDVLDDEDAARLVLTAGLLADIDGGPFVQCDLVSVDDLRVAGRAQFPLPGRSSTTRLSDLVNPLVIAEDGGVRPFVYGLDGRWQLTTLDAVADGRWRQLRDEQRDDLTDLIERTFVAVGRRSARFVDFYGVLTDVASSSPVFPAG